MWTRENVNGFLDWVGRDESIAWARCEDLMPCCNNNFSKEAFSLTSWKRQREQDLWLILSWYECLISIDPLTSSHHAVEDTGIQVALKVQVLFLGPWQYSDWCFAGGESHIPMPTFISWAFHIPAVTDSFSPLKQNKCKRMCLLFTLSNSDLKPRSMGRGTLDCSLETVSAAEQG